MKRGVVVRVLFRPLFSSPIFVKFPPHFSEQSYTPGGKTYERMNNLNFEILDPFM
jgi:hypothetical protein